MSLAISHTMIKLFCVFMLYCFVDAYTICGLRINLIGPEKKTVSDTESRFVFSEALGISKCPHISWDSNQVLTPGFNASWFLFGETEGERHFSNPDRTSSCWYEAILCGLRVAKGCKHACTAANKTQFEKAHKIRSHDLVISEQNSTINIE